MNKDEVVAVYNQYCEKYPDAVKYSGRMRSTESPDDCVSIRCAIAREAFKNMTIRSRDDIRADARHVRRQEIRALVEWAIAYDLGLDSVSTMKDWIVKGFIAAYNYY